MLSSLVFFIYAFTVAVSANRAFPPLKFIKLSLGISKSTYLPLKGSKFIQSGSIIENRYPRDYDPTNDKTSCSTKSWTAKSYEHKEAEILMFTHTQQKIVVFGFRGTETFSVKDWLKNFEASPVRMSIGKATFDVHKGYAQRYSFIAPWFEAEYKKIPQDYTIIITGHSLGGTGATMAAVYAAGKLKRKPDAVVTFASPRLGTGNFKKYYNKVVGCDRTVRMATKGDWLTNLPFWFTPVCDKTEIDGDLMNVAKSHDLFTGYEAGIAKKYPMNKINFGCDQLLT